MEVKPIDYCPYYGSSDCPDGDDPCGDRGNSTESATQAVFHKHISKSGLKVERENLAKKLDEEDSIRTIQKDFPTFFKEVLLKMRNTYLLSEKFQTLKVALEMIIDKSNTDFHQRFTLNQKFQKAIEEYGSSFSILNYHQFKNIITDIVLDKSS